MDSDGFSVASINQTVQQLLMFSVRYKCFFLFICTNLGGSNNYIVRCSSMIAYMTEPIMFVVDCRPVDQEVFKVHFKM